MKHNKEFEKRQIAASEQQAQAAEAQAAKMQKKLNEERGEDATGSEAYRIRTTAARDAELAKAAADKQIDSEQDSARVEENKARMAQLQVARLEDRIKEQEFHLRNKVMDAEKTENYKTKLKKDQLDQEVIQAESMQRADLASLQRQMASEVAAAERAAVLKKSKDTEDYRRKIQQI